MPRDNDRIYGSSSWYIGETPYLTTPTVDGVSRIVDVNSSGSISTRISTPNELSSMFAEKRAKKNGHKSTDKLLLELKQADEQNLGLRRELNTKMKENEEMKARIEYLEEAILELEGK